MERERRHSFTISQWMIATAALAIGLTLVRPRAWLGSRLAAEVGVAAGVLLALLVAVTLNLLVESFVGIQCPACGRWTLRRLARYRRYYRCAVCRARYHRVWFGPWRDASGPDEDVKFRGDVAARAWRGYETPVEPGDTPSGQLLRNKRRRASTRDDPYEDS